jgi:hypothetical protein
MPKTRLCRLDLHDKNLTISLRAADIESATPASAHNSEYSRMPRLRRTKFGTESLHISWRFADLNAVVNHYDKCMNLGLTDGERSDLVQYLLSLNLSLLVDSYERKNDMIRLQPESRLFAQTPLIRLWLALGRSECCYGLAPLLTGDLDAFPFVTLLPPCD